MKIKPGFVICLSGIIVTPVSMQLVSGVIRIFKRFCQNLVYQPHVGIPQADVEPILRREWLVI